MKKLSSILSVPFATRRSSPAQHCRQCLPFQQESARIPAMDKTVKIRALSDDASSVASQSNLAENHNKSIELANKNAQLEEERKLSLEQLKIIEQLRESLRQEQAKMAEMAKKTAGVDANELAVKDAQLEEEKSRSLENLKTIVQLRESLKQEQAKTAEMTKNKAEQDAKLKDLAVLEASELAKKNAQIEEAKNKSLEHLKTIEQLRNSLKQEQAIASEMVDKAANLDAKTKELTSLEAKVKELTEALGKISSIAAAVEAD